MKRLTALIFITFLGACTAQMQDELARNAAKDAVRPVLAQQFPGVPPEGATDCMIDNASAEEILSLAADSVTGPTASTVEIVGRIAARPDTIQCLLNEDASLALAGGLVI